MANTLNGVNLDRIADLALPVLMTEAIALSSFATDFSSEAMATGQSVTVQLPVQPSTQDFSSSKAPADVTVNSVKVDINQYKGVALGFTDLERTYTDIDLINLFIQPAIVACFEDVFASIFALVLNANYSQSVVKTAAQFDADAVADLAGNLTTAKVPKKGRSLIIKPTYYANLVKDNAIQAAYAQGSNAAITENRVDNVHNFRVIEFNGTIPANAESLEGIAVSPVALAVASRGVVPPEPGTWYGQVTDVTDPKSGLTLQFRRHYNGTKQVIEVGLNYGVKKAQAAGLYRIKSA